MSQEILDAIDARIATLWPVIVAAQAQFYAINGVYAQGLSTHTTTPQDGQEAAPDNATAAPPDLPQSSWAQLAQAVGVSLPSSWLSSLRCDNYGGPNGDGYVIVASVTIDGVLWQRSINVGSESWRGHEWQPVTQDAEP